MNKIVLFSDGSWEWEDLSSIKVANSGLKHVVLTIGYGWLDHEVSHMVRDYYYGNTLSWIFEQ